MPSSTGWSNGSAAEMIELTVRRESWPLRNAFTISRGSKTSAEVVLVELDDGRHRGRGECLPYARYGETVEGVMATLDGQSGALSKGLDREALQSALPPGAARNALDCAFWDLEAKRHGKRVWELLGLPAPGPVTTAYTLSLAPAEAMRRAAAEHAERPLLKLKLAGPEDLARVRAVREGAPQARLVVDANEGWTAAFYSEIAPELVGLGVEMIEQPLPADADEALAGIERPIKVCADESCHDSASLSRLKGLYDVVNIKLDKTGGLTEALRLKGQAEAAGFDVMVGCMIATSLSMAPAQLVAQGAAVVDLDGPLLLAEDRADGLAFEGGLVYPPSANLWG
ncbi:MAG TPA: N-acetyl-D-Glu racemase DgcA [Kiloniellaceae bacterium]|nr:N-acetyl-D-Glu racemase DgcA [Kiloniellaceae bacterium]